MRSNNIGTQIITIAVTLLIVAVITDWVSNKNGPVIVTGLSNVFAKVIDVSLGKDTTK